MDGKLHVFISEFISEDTNVWDGRERFGVFTTFEGAAESMKWATKYDENGKWVETDTYGTSDHGKRGVKGWKWTSEPNEDGEWEDDGDGYGNWIWEEYVD